MPSDIRVCFLGDSFVAGVGDPEHLGWTGRLAARSELAGQSLTTYNLGVRRETSSDVLARWRTECAPRLPATSDGRVVVSLGVNDTTEEDGGTRVPPHESTANLSELLLGLQVADWPALVVGPPPVGDDDQNIRIGLLDGAFARACSAARLPYVSTFPGLLADEVWRQEVEAGDGSHPAAAGYQRLADIIWPSWMTWLAGAPGVNSPTT